MNSSRLFDADGHARLRQLLQSTRAPRPTPSQHESLTAILEQGSVSRDTAETALRVAPGDHVRLVAPGDPGDWYELELVMPADADVDADRISLLTPVGLALLGRRTGDLVAWEAPAGTRQMVIDSVTKPVAAGT